MALLFAHWPGHGLSITCSEPAGRDLYVAELFTVCSALEGLPGFGMPPAELEKCARSDFTGQAGGVSYGVTVDGHPARTVVGATGTYYVPKVVRGGICGQSCVPAPTAYAAGYGAEVLLSGLSKGTHIIHHTVSAPFNVSVTYTIHVS